MTVVIDASALLAFFFDEPGGEVMLEQARNAPVSTVNLFEAAAKARYYKGLAPDEVTDQLLRLGIRFAAFEQEQAILAATLPAKIGKRSLSMADRACLSLAMHRSLPILTGDRVWAELDLDVTIQLIR
ncbi:PIN domain nuclease of toxin-antitoxin system [Sphingomonas vulcanisoli]|uniref:PIN domain nuclease of toxin-antitoxin system n=1 Tax=Sphingomonas vulcanisoli TaxID=1658060 RepID=A0ABX0TLM8_9SPHN|nr:type II toxin-antitoxin system VapC family toxin [Sphingomonas vulcanisoli]NIJ06428.1 PIN domain nuclease of toxin-antitoxin system [Sphingomonas vulcanisoli]